MKHRIIRILRIILIVFAAVLIFAGISYVLNGSLEMYPTAEQQGKAKIGGALITLFGVAVGAAGIIIRPKK